MNSFFISLVANTGGGNAGAAALLIIGIVWLGAYMCRPGRKGWDVNHKAQTTIKPR